MFGISSRQKAIMPIGYWNSMRNRYKANDRQE